MIFSEISSEALLVVVAVATAEPNIRDQLVQFPARSRILHQERKA